MELFSKKLKYFIEPINRFHYKHSLEKNSNPDFFGQICLQTKFCGFGQQNSSINILRVLKTTQINLSSAYVCINNISTDLTRENLNICSSQFGYFQIGPHKKNTDHRASLETLPQVAHTHRRVRGTE